MMSLASRRLSTRYLAPAASQLRAILIMHAVQRMHTKYTKLSVDESNEIARIVKVDLTSALSKAPAPLCTTSQARFTTAPTNTSGQPA